MVATKTDHTHLQDGASSSSSSSPRLTSHLLIEPPATSNLRPSRWKPIAAALLSAVCAVSAAPAPVYVSTPGHEARDVDETFPYTGPAIPVGDWVGPSVNGVKASGCPRLVEPPAVTPATENPSNNINVISLSYIPNGISIHFQTPFGLDEDPTVFWGRDRQQPDLHGEGCFFHVSSSLPLSDIDTMNRTDRTYSYDRTPPCSPVSATQCNQHFHDVQIDDLKPATTNYYQIAPSNGTAGEVPPGDDPGTSYDAPRARARAARWAGDMSVVMEAN